MRKWLLMAGITILLGGAVLLFLLSQQTNADELSRSEAEAKVAELYGGKVVETRPTGESYDIAFDREEGRYVASINKETKQIESLKLIEKAQESKKLTEEEALAIAAKEVSGQVEDIVYSIEQNEYRVAIAGEKNRSTVVIAADTGEIRNISNEALDSEPERIISQEEAIALAKKTLDGEVTEVEFVETDDGGYYLIDLEKDETDQEVRVQIHAIRGETMTVEWDD